MSNKMNTKKLLLVLLLFVPVSYIWKDFINDFINDFFIGTGVFANILSTIRIFNKGFFTYIVLFTVLKRLTFPEKSFRDCLQLKWVLLILGIIVANGVAEFLISKLFYSETLILCIMTNLVWAIAFILITYCGLSSNEKITVLFKKSFCNFKGILLIVFVVADIMIDYTNAFAFQKQLSEGLSSGSLFGYFSLLSQNSLWDRLDMIVEYFVIIIIVFSMYKASDFTDDAKKTLFELKK